MLGKEYLDYYNFGAYVPKRRRLFYIPLKNGFTKSNYRYVVFDWGRIVDFKTQHSEYEADKKTIDNIIRIHKKWLNK